MGPMRDLLIRRSRHIVQDRPSRAVRWADIPALSARVSRCLPAWQQSRRSWHRSRLSLSSGNCAVTARTLQGMARVRPGQAPAWPLSSDRSVRRGSGVKRDFACTFTSYFPARARCPAVTVTLEAGGADTYTQRAIPGSEANQRLLHPGWPHRARHRGPGGQSQTGGCRVSARVSSKGWRVLRRLRDGRTGGAADPLGRGASGGSPGQRRMRRKTACR